MTLLSIIIPVYNSEKYIQQCLISILSQNFTSYECIIIDDCSKDNSAKIIQNFILENKQTNRFRYIKNEYNIKQGLTRNYGVSLAKGKFIMFIDNDDILPPMALENMLCNITDNTEIIIGNFARFKNTVEPIKTCWQSNINEQNFYIPREENFSNLYNLVYPWGKIYSREFWLKNNFKFSKERFEDTILWAAISSCANNIIICKDVIYWHRICNPLSDGSITPQKFSVYYNSLYARLEILKQYNLLKQDSFYITFCLADAYQIIQDTMFSWQRYKLFCLLRKYINILPNETYFNNKIIPTYKIKKLQKMYKLGFWYFIFKPKKHFFNRIINLIYSR